MNRNRVKDCFKRHQLALNSYFRLADPAVVELIGLAGFDAVTIDLEHMAFDLPLVQQMIIAAERVDITSVVRIPARDWATALRVLDAGAQGIQVPHVTDRETAEEAVAAVRYRPLGKRGAMGSGRAARWGDIPWTDHVRSSNENVLLNIMIEDVEGLERIDSIAAVPGIDVVIIGTRDLAEAMSIREVNHPGLRAAVENLVTRVSHVGEAVVGLSVGEPLLGFSIVDLIRLDVGYAILEPAAERRMLSALRQAVADARQQEVHSN